MTAPEEVIQATQIEGDSAFEVLVGRVPLMKVVPTSAENLGQTAAQFLIPPPAKTFESAITHLQTREDRDELPLTSYEIVPELIAEASWVANVRVPTIIVAPQNFGDEQGSDIRLSQITLLPPGHELQQTGVVNLARLTPESQYGLTELIRAVAIDLGEMNTADLSPESRQFFDDHGGIAAITNEYVKGLQEVGTGILTGQVANSEDVAVYEQKDAVLVSKQTQKVVNGILTITSLAGIGMIGYDLVKSFTSHGSHAAAAQDLSPTHDILTPGPQCTWNETTDTSAPYITAPSDVGDPNRPWYQSYHLPSPPIVGATYIDIESQFNQPFALEFDQLNQLFDAIDNPMAIFNGMPLGLYPTDEGNVWMIEGTNAPAIEVALLVEEWRNGIPDNIVSAGWNKWRFRNEQGKLEALNPVQQVALKLLLPSQTHPPGGLNGLHSEQDIPERLQTQQFELAQVASDIISDTVYTAITEIPGAVTDSDNYASRTQIPLNSNNGVIGIQLSDELAQQLGTDEGLVSQWTTLVNRLNEGSVDATGVVLEVIKTTDTDGNNLVFSAIRVTNPDGLAFQDVNGEVFLSEGTLFVINGNGAVRGLRPYGKYGEQSFTGLAIVDQAWYDFLSQEPSLHSIPPIGSAVVVELGFTADGSPRLISMMLHTDQLVGGIGTLYWPDALKEFGIPNPAFEGQEVRDEGTIALVSAKQTPQPRGFIADIADPAGFEAEFSALSPDEQARVVAQVFASTLGISPEDPTMVDTVLRRTDMYSTDELVTVYLEGGTWNPQLSLITREVEGQRQQVYFPENDGEGMWLTVDILYDAGATGSQIFAVPAGETGLYFTTDENARDNAFVKVTVNGETFEIPTLTRGMMFGERNPETDQPEFTLDQLRNRPMAYLAGTVSTTGIDGTVLYTEALLNQIEVKYVNFTKTMFVVSTDPEIITESEGGWIWFDWFGDKFAYKVTTIGEGTPENPAIPVFMYYIVPQSDFFANPNSDSTREEQITYNIADFTSAITQMALHSSTKDDFIQFYLRDGKLKMGFYPNSPLMYPIEYLIDEKRSRSEGYFDTEGDNGTSSFGIRLDSEVE